MRILQVVNIGFEAGGAEKSVRLIADGLTARGHEVQIVATDRRSAGQQMFADHLVPAIRGAAPRRFARYLWHHEAYRRVRAIVDEFRPDCVHLHTIGEFSPAVLAATAGVPRVLTVHGPEDWTLRLLRWNLASAARPGGLTAADRLRYAYLRLVQRPAYRLRLRHVDRILTPSRYFADQVAADVDIRRTYVVPNGIGPASTSPPGRGCPQAEPIGSSDQILFVGRLERVKGVAVLLEAFWLVAAAFPQAQLTIVGDGPDLADLVAAYPGLVAAGRVRFTGWLSDVEVAAAIARSSMLVVPSLWPENFPTVALEALRAGRALIGSRVGGLPELIDADNGILVPPGDPAALASALAELMAQPYLLTQLGLASAKRAEEYDAARFLATLLHHYEEVAR